MPHSITWYVIYWSYYPFFQDLILRPYQKLYYGVRVLAICWYIIVFEYSSELFRHSSDTGYDYREFPLRGIQGGNHCTSIVFSPDSTVASVWVTEGSGVSLDVWSSIGVSSMSVSFGWVLLIN